MRLTLAVIFTLLTASLAFSQSPEEWKKRGVVFESQGKHREALDAFLKAEEKTPEDADLLVKIAKQYSDIMVSLKGAARREASQKSLIYAKRAVAAEPEFSDSHLAVAISLGKSTEFMGNKEKLEASRKIKKAADTALRLNPESDYAHHIIGRWHQEIAGIGGGTRVLAKVIYGEIPKGSYQEALKHFDAARKLMPSRLTHQIEYGRTLALMGNTENARREIQKGLAMPTREADDTDSKASGRKTLKTL